MLKYGWDYKWVIFYRIWKYWGRWTNLKNWFESTKKLRICSGNVMYERTLECVFLELRFKEIISSSIWSKFRKFWQLSWCCRWSVDTIDSWHSSGVLYFSKLSSTLFVSVWCNSSNAKFVVLVVNVHTDVCVDSGQICLSGLFGFGLKTFDLGSGRVCGKTWELLRNCCGGNSVLSLTGIASEGILLNFWYCCGRAFEMVDYQN